MNYSFLELINTILIPFLILGIIILIRRYVLFPKNSIITPENSNVADYTVTNAIDVVLYIFLYYCSYIGKYYVNQLFIQSVIFIATIILSINLVIRIRKHNINNPNVLYKLSCLALSIIVAVPYMLFLYTIFGYFAYSGH